jgi:DNA-binding winged helix-turn-helix (wHTH) protein
MHVTFADCVLDSTARQLIRSGRVVPLEPKMFQFLEVLIQRRPAVVTNNELDEILWPKVYVARTSLTRLVCELRSLIGDTARESRIIRTVYKTGYAFCAKVISDAALRSPARTIYLLWNDQQIGLADGENIAGRGPECSVVIDANTVSRRHAQISISGGAASIQDLGSTNGTHVNGAPISSPTPIVDGDEIAFGVVVVRFRACDPSAPTILVTSRADATAGRR